MNLDPNRCKRVGRVLTRLPNEPIDCFTQPYVMEIQCANEPNHNGGHLMVLPDESTFIPMESS